MSLFQKAACPICKVTFPMSSINAHIDSCIKVGNASEKQDLDPICSKSPEEHDKSPTRKRPRISPGRDSQAAKVSLRQQTDVTPTESDKTVMAKRATGTYVNRENPKTLWDAILRPQGAITRDLGSNVSKTKKPTPVKGSRQAPSATTTTVVAGTEHGRVPPLGKVDFRPLADRMRPQSLSEFVGQEKAVGHRSLLRRLMESDSVPSMIFWGPPGCGKTTLAHILAQKAKSNNRTRFVQLSATTANVAIVKDAITAAANEQRMTKRKTILFIDEIHRFNKAQQDTFLPHIENGTITLIGATTENPSFKINSALLSRCQVVVLDKLGTDELMLILRRAVGRLGVRLVGEGTAGEGGSSSGEDDDDDEVNDGKRICMETSALTYLANLCDGDARSALNTLQMVVHSEQQPPGQSAAEPSGPWADCGPGQGAVSNGAPSLSCIMTKHVKEALQRSHVMYDRQGDEHFHCISALIKSMRGSDANAALYWLARMVVGGEDPLYIARRLIAFASEDVGLADPQALPQAVATHQACQFLGQPACGVNLAQCVIYLAKAPKSPMVEGVFMHVMKYVKESEGPLPGVPLHLRPGSTQLLRDLGYGKGYVHSAAAGDQGFLPESMKGVDFFQNSKELYL